MLFLKLQENKWYITKKGLNLLKNHPDFQLVIQTFFFSEGSSEMADKFFLDQLHTGFDKSFLRTKGSDVLCIADIQMENSLLKLTLFGCLPVVIGKGLQYELLSQIGMDSVIPDFKNMQQSVVTPRNKVDSIDRNLKTHKEVFRNLFSLLEFLSCQCFSLSENGEEEFLCKEYFRDYHLLSRFRPSKQTFQIQTKFTALLGSQDFEARKQKCIENLRKDCKYFLEMSKESVRVKQASLFNEEISTQIIKGDRVKTLRERPVTCAELKNLLSSFSETLEPEIEVFQMWAQVTKDFQNQQISEIISECTGGFKERVIEVVKVLVGPFMAKEFVALKVKQ